MICVVIGVVALIAIIAIVVHFAKKSNGWNLVILFDIYLSVLNIEINSKDYKQIRHSYISALFFNFGSIKGWDDLWESADNKECLI